MAFASLADTLVPDDTNLAADVFVRDRAADRIERVSVGPFGLQGDDNSGMLSLLDRPDISADGRFVVFASEASNFVAGDVPGTADVFIHDRRTGRTGLISRGVDGFPAGGSVAPAISADGRFVAFRSLSDRLVPDGNPNVFDHIYVFDRRAGSIERVDVASDGTIAAGSALNLAISADGRFVVFSSRASNLVRRDTNQSVDVFRRDLETGVTERLAADGTTADRPFGFDVTASDITPNAGVVALLTRADLLPEQDFFFAADVYVFDPRRPGAR